MTEPFSNRERYGEAVFAWIEAAQVELAAKNKRRRKQVDIKPITRALTHEQETLMSLCDCAACPMAQVRNPVFGKGGTGGIALVGAAPSLPEVRTREPMYTDASMLSATLKEQGIDPKTEVYRTNLVLCAPATLAKHAEDKVTATAVKACSKRLILELRTVKPQVTVALGAAPSKALLNTSLAHKDLIGALDWSDIYGTHVLPTVSTGAIRLSHDNFDDLLAALQRAARLVKGTIPFPTNEQLMWEYVTDPKLAAGKLKAILDGRAGKTLAIDVETTGFNYWTHKLTMVAIANTEKAVVFDYDATLKTDANRALMAQVLRSDITWIAHNKKFDKQWLFDHFGVWVAAEDTMCLALGLTERAKGVGLKRISRDWLNAGHYERGLEPFVAKYKDAAYAEAYKQAPRMLAEYAGYDVLYTARVHPMLTKACKSEGTYELATGLLSDAQDLFARMEYDGAHVDITYAQQLMREWRPKIEALELQIQEYARSQGFYNDDGTPLNVRSDQQLEHLIYNVLGFPELRLWKVRPRNTGKEWRAANKRDTLSVMLEQHSLAEHMLNTYVHGIITKVDYNNYIHPDILLFGAKTGRLSMRNPPMQTIPKGSTVKDFASIKTLVIPDNPDDEVIFDCDFSNLEVRVGWHYSQDANLGKAVMSGDFHRTTAAHVFKVPFEDVTDEQRNDSKPVTFGIMYGRGARALAEGELDTTTEIAQGYINNWFAGYPDYYRFTKEVEKEAFTTGRVRTVFNRVRRFNLITDDLRWRIRNQAVNFPIQSTASDMCLLAGIKVDRELRARGWGRLLFLVHDSLVANVKRKYTHEAAALIREIMVTPPFETCATFDVDVKVGDTWGTTKALT